MPQITSPATVATEVATRATRRAMLTAVHWIRPGRRYEWPRACSSVACNESGRGRSHGRDPSGAAGSPRRTRRHGNRSECAVRGLDERHDLVARGEVQAPRLTHESVEHLAERVDPLVVAVADHRLARAAQ